MTPTIIVIFGATGDLMRNKIAPALFHLFDKGQLPSFFHVIGFSRGDIDDLGFCNFIKNNLLKHEGFKESAEKTSQFLKLFSFQKGLFENLRDYNILGKAAKAIDDRWGVCTNKLFYLAASPGFYETIFKNLAKSGLTKPCSNEEGWTRVIVEKPFGTNLKTAGKLESLLSKLFKEVQIYRIDHYLAKEMLQNILAFRFSNNIFENSWSSGLIEKIEIRLWEKGGVEDRGSFYDGIGALRDVGQNHLLQMLALIIMDNPVNFSADAIRGKREDVLKSLNIPSAKEIKSFSFRAQYNGYSNIKGVVKNSKTETYFKIRAFLSLAKWHGVPIIMESGKKLQEQIKEIIITFKHPMPCLCPDGIEMHGNKIIIRLEPEEKISLSFWVKKPGFGFQIEERTFNFFYRETGNRSQYTEEYERLLLDCINGDQTLFVSSQEVKAMWRHIDPIAKAWKNNAVPLEKYNPNTDEAIAASQHINKSSAVMASKIKKEIAIIGLGKMGGNCARNLLEKGWKVLGYDKSPELMSALKKEGLASADSLKQIVEKCSLPRLFWLSLPAGKAVDQTIFELEKYLKKGDIIIDAGNSFFKDSITRCSRLKRKGIHFVDVGVSGGPEGARRGASLMIGGRKDMFLKLEPLFEALAAKGGYQFFEGSGAGHFVKMVHNGIEYGMMQAIAEGFAVLKKAEYKLDLSKVANVYNHGSVIESRLISWLQKAFELHGDGLKKVIGRVAHTGEAEWTVKTAKELNLKTAVIEAALQFRIQSEKNPSYAGKILSSLRQQFGQHKAI